MTRKGGREVSEPKEAVNLLSLGHFCARTANKKGLGRGGQDRFPAKLFSRDSRETNFTRRNFKDEEVLETSLDSRELGMKNEEEFRIIWKKNGPSVFFSSSSSSRKIS